MLTILYIRVKRVDQRRVVVGKGCEVRVESARMTGAGKNGVGKVDFITSL